MQKRFPPFPVLGKTARRMLQCELPLVLLAAVVLLILYLCAYETDPGLASLRYAEVPVTLLASLALSICTSLLCDLAERRNRND